jgi:pimeloyl-ACP methyl ester carboxylesterase
MRAIHSHVVTFVKAGRINRHMKKRMHIRLLPSSSRLHLGLRQLLGETRVFGEWMLFTLDGLLHPPLAIRGRGRGGVLLIPGFGAGDISLSPLVARLRELGYPTFASGIWCNLDCPAHTMPRLEKVLRKAKRKTYAKVTIIGHSLGGLYARQLACLFPDLVDRVILLGSPVKKPLDGSNSFLRPIFEFWHRRCADGFSGSPEPLDHELSASPPLVPETLIYSRTDGVVNWQNCIETGARVEAIEVPSSHCGLPFSPKVMEIIEDRLARRSERGHILTVNGAASKFQHPLNRVRVSLTSVKNHRPAA